MDPFYALLVIPFRCVRRLEGKKKRKKKKGRKKEKKKKKKKREEKRKKKILVGFPTQPAVDAFIRPRG